VMLRFVDQVGLSQSLFFATERGDVFGEIRGFGTRQHRLAMVDHYCRAVDITEITQPCRSPPSRGAKVEGDANPRNPMRGTLPEFCVYAGADHAARMHTPATNSRRLIR
jgi:hypothetical protein